MLMCNSASAWDGLYFGVNGGYGGANININKQELTVYDTNMYSTVFKGSSYQGDYTKLLGVSGAAIGGQAGYLFSTYDRVLIGPEISMNWLNIGLETSRNGSYSPNSLSGTYYSGSTNSNTVDWQGIGAVRVGYDFGRFFPYLSAGINLGQVSNYRSYGGNFYVPFRAGNTYYVGGYDGSYYYSGSRVSAGLAAGAGIETHIWDRLSLKTEYLYSELSGAKSNGAYGPSSSPIPPYTVYHNEITGRLSIHQIRTGLNYHLNGYTDNYPVAEGIKEEWTGIYLGAQGGYGGGNSQVGGVTTGFGGATAGGVVGINYEFSNKIVLGGDLSGSWVNFQSGESKSSQTAANLSIYSASQNDRYRIAQYANNSSQKGYEWKGIGKLRLGYDIGRFLPYAFFGGVVANQFESSSMNGLSSIDIVYGNRNYLSPLASIYAYRGHDSATKVVGGWVTGIGGEYKLTDLITVHSEYMLSLIHI